MLFKGENMNHKRQTFINLFSTIISFLVTFFISFFLTPRISELLPGSYGYVKLANDFVSYISIITIALNSMASRFITIEYKKGNKDKACAYYSSVFYANIFLCIILIFISTYIVLNIENLISIDIKLLKDVRLLFLMTFIGFILSIFGSTYSVFTFVINRLDIKSYIDIICSIVRIVLIIIFFFVITPNIYYLGFITAFISFLTLIIQLILSKKYLPDLVINKRLFRIDKIYELFKSGIWNSIVRLSQVLLDGLDLIISNIFVSANAMNVLAFAKTLPSFIGNIIITIAGVFVPKMLDHYAQKNTKDLFEQSSLYMICLSLFTAIFIGGLTIYSLDFYKLWLPNEDIQLITIITIVNILPYLISAPLNIVFNYFTIYNEVKKQSVAFLISGLINTLLVFIVLKNTSYGIYAIAFISSIISIIRNVVYIIPAIKNMTQCSYSFLIKPIIYCIISSTIFAIIGLILKKYIMIDSWLKLFSIASINTFIYCIIIFIIYLKKGENTKCLK